MKALIFAATVCFCAAGALAQKAENTLSDAERREGWLLLFDGKTHTGWMNSDGTKPRKLVEDGALNPHGTGHYMLVHEKQWENFVLSLNFKITPRCNSGVFVRTSSLTPRPGKDIGTPPVDPRLGGRSGHSVCSAPSPTMSPIGGPAGMRVPASNLTE